MLGAAVYKTQGRGDERGKGRYIIIEAASSIFKIYQYPDIVLLFYLSSPSAFWRRRKEFNRRFQKTARNQSKSRLFATALAGCSCTGACTAIEWRVDVSMYTLCLVIDRFVT
jgi:hypothetical protein